MSVQATHTRPGPAGAGGTSRLGSLLRLRELPVTVALVALVIVTAAVNPLFLSPQGMKDLMLNATIMMLLAAGQTMVIVTRNIDLSVGSILGLVAFGTGSIFAAAPTMPIWLVLLIGVGFGALLGSLNGLLTVWAKVPSLVITLGTLYVFRGANNGWAGPRQFFAGDRPEAFGNLSVDTLLGVPIITVLALAVVIVLAVYLAGARSGRDLYAIGSDPEAAKLFGINTTTRVFTAFLVNGALAGLAGVLYASRFNAVGATTGSGLELDVVAAAVVGGVAIFGGSGTVIGAAIGAILLNTITSSLTALRVDKFWQQAIVGVLIITAILIDRLASLRHAKHLREKEGRNV